MKINKNYIEFEKSKQFSNLFIDYVNQQDPLKKFYNEPPVIESFQKMITASNFKQVNRKKIVDVITSQYQSSGITVPSTVSLLLNENTFTVCTGHQLCLFTGPLYFIYKILSTINLAEELKKKYPNNEFIPIYWMASEDHDYDEIKSIHLFGKTITWEKEEAKGAVGRIKTKGIEQIIAELRGLVGDTENAQQIIHLFEEAYLTSENLAFATRALVHQLFANYNLIVLDPDDKELKIEFASMMADDIFHSTNYPLVNTSINELNAQGYSAQVNPREINCFYLTDTNRERIEKKGEQYIVLNTDISFTKEELQKELEGYPEKFSPNVVMRPLYQQTILPNIAYVGGPGELAYWLEYKQMFDYHQVVFPVLMPRNFTLLIDSKSNAQLHKLGFTIADLLSHPEDLLVREMIKKNASHAISVKEEELKITQVYTELMSKASAIDSTLKATVEAELQKALNSIKNIENKLLKSEKQKQETTVNQLKKIRAKVLPNETLQERYENFIPYYLKYGNELIETLKNSFTTFDKSILILELE